ncbi:MAG: hypothetical protein V3T24_13000 [Longimicrobiales bacterium]
MSPASPVLAAGPSATVGDGVRVRCGRRPRSDPLHSSIAGLALAQVEEELRTLIRDGRSASAV